MSEIPVHFRPRRLADWINPTGAKKVHSLVDKVYKRKNLEMAWEKVKANRGSGGVDGQTLETFEAQLERLLTGSCVALSGPDSLPGRGSFHRWMVRATRGYCPQEWECLTLPLSG